jgi:hypothetical protein
MTLSPPWSKVVVLRGDKGWSRFGTEVTHDLTGEELSEQREVLHARTVATLLPVLRGGGYTLATLAEADEGGTDSVGFRVIQPGHGDVKLFFGRRSGLLFSYASLTTVDGVGVARACLLRDYREFGGVFRPRKMILRLGGKVVSRLTVTAYQALEDVDDREFAKP